MKNRKFTNYKKFYIFFNILARDLNKYFKKKKIKNLKSQTRKKAILNLIQSQTLIKLVKNLLFLKYLKNFHFTKLLEKNLVIIKKKVIIHGL